jgi:hypothetical protein
VTDLYSLGRYLGDWGYTRVESVGDDGLAAVGYDHVLLVRRVDADEAGDWLDAGDLP